MTGLDTWDLLVQMEATPEAGLICVLLSSSDHLLQEEDDYFLQCISSDQDEEAAKTNWPYLDKAEDLIKINYSNRGAPISDIVALGGYRFCRCECMDAICISITPALATSLPQCEFPETISTPSLIIHTTDEGFIYPRKYRWRIFAQLQKFQGSVLLENQLFRIMNW